MFWEQRQSLALAKGIFWQLQELISIEDVPEGPSLSSKIEFQPHLPYLISDPRTNFIKRLAEKTCSYLIENHQLPSPSSFRIKDLKNWFVRLGPNNLLSQMSWDCRTNCKFCCLKGNPPETHIKKRITLEELKTRLKYYNGKNQSGIIGGEFIQNDEILNNPHIRQILKAIRQKGYKRLIEITTNGTALTQEKIAVLKESMPLLFTISLNSSNPRTRKWLMNDPAPEIAINSLPVLKKNKIPYIVSIVVWPGLPFQDIEQTIDYARKNGAYHVRLILPGHSKYFSKKKLFSTKRYWSKIVKHFYPLSLKSAIPILILPDMFAQYILNHQIDRPIIIGPIINSPAALAGIKAGDHITKIDGQKINSIEQAYYELRNKKRIHLKIKRRNKVLTFKLNNDTKSPYPFNHKALKQLDPFGILLPVKFFSHEDLKDIEKYIILREARNVLVLTSVRAKPIIEHLLKKYDVSQKTGATIKIKVAKNHSFGGSIDTADLLTAADFIKAIKALTYSPDLVVLPATPFNEWGRDLIGGINLDIERETGIPVEFVYNRRAYER